jgi:hypothetical protein
MDVHLAGRYAYVADANSGLRILDIAVPVSPVLRAYYDTPYSAYGVTLYGSKAYIADWGCGLAIVEPVLGVEEGLKPQASSPKLPTTIVHGQLWLPRDMTELPGNSDRVPRLLLLDAAGRKTMSLRPGANDVSRLAPGVYFVRAVSRELSAASCQKVVIQR